MLHNKSLKICPYFFGAHYQDGSLFIASGCRWYPIFFLNRKSFFFCNKCWNTTSVKFCDIKVHLSCNDISTFKFSELVLCVRERWYISFKTVRNRWSKFADNTVLCVTEFWRETIFEIVRFSVTPNKPMMLSARLVKKLFLCNNRFCIIYLILHCDARYIFRHRRVQNGSL